MNKLIVVVFVNWILLSSSSVLASSVQFNKKYYTHFHYTEEAFGKSVKTVFAHYGVLIEQKKYDGSSQESLMFWDNIEHKEMERFGDHFYHKTILEASGHFTSGPYKKVLGVMIQYWVYFDDGTELITDAFHISRCKESFHLYYDSSETARLENLIDNFLNREDGEETGCLIEISNFN